MAHELESGPDDERATKRSPVPDDEPPDQGRCDNRSGSVGRRGYLRWGAAAVAMATLGVGGASAGSTRDGIGFERVVDAVEDLGADPTGTRPVNRRLADVSSNSLVRFPEGKYRLDGRVELSELGRVGFESPGDAVFVGTEPNSGLSVESTEEVYYTGFTHAESVGTIRHEVNGAETVLLRDIDDENEVASAGARENRLEVVATDAVASYEMTVSGGIAPVDDGHTPPDLDVSGGCVEGTVAFDTHALEYSGVVTAVDVTGNATVQLNGEVMDVDRRSGAVDPRLASSVHIESTDGRDPARYEFVATGDVAVDVDRTDPCRGRGILAEEARAGTVTGSVGNGAKAYHFSRGIDTLDVRGPSRISIGSDR